MPSRSPSHNFDPARFGSWRLRVQCCCSRGRGLPLVGGWVSRCCARYLSSTIGTIAPGQPLYIYKKTEHKKYRLGGIFKWISTACVLRMAILIAIFGRDVELGMHNSALNTRYVCVLFQVLNDSKHPACVCFFSVLNDSIDPFWARCNGSIVTQTSNKFSVVLSTVLSTAVQVVTYMQRARRRATHCCV